jgi:hypothetical protein
MSTVRIASVHFHSLTPIERSGYGGFYTAPAVKPGSDPVFIQQRQNINGKVRMIEGCTDMISVEHGGFTDSPNPRVRSRRRTTVFGEEIARDLVNEWTKLVHGATTEPPCYPGIWVVRDRLPAVDEDGKLILDADGRQSWRDATEAEKKSMWDEDIKLARTADANYARSIFDTWNAQIERYPDFVKTLPQEVRVAADVYGWTADWLRDGTVIEMKDCPYCTRKVRAKAIVCPHCREVVDAEAYAREQKKRADALAKHGVPEAPNPGPRKAA